MNFKLNMGDEATIAASGESGEVLARSEYVSSENAYLIRYKSADGRAVEAWWGESALESVE